MVKKVGVVQSILYHSPALALSQATFYSCLKACPRQPFILNRRLAVASRPKYLAKMLTKVEMASLLLLRSIGGARGQRCVALSLLRG
jgi:hypothetical protein